MLKRISHPYTCLVIIAVLLAITIRPLHASDLSFTQCNAASSSGKYDEAITCYQKIIETRGYSAAVLYNLASSYAQSGNNGLAILNYERALRLAPSDPDILGNLEAVRKSSGLFASDPTFVESLVQTFSVDSWAILGLLLFGTFSLFIFLAFRYQWKPLPRYCGALAIVSLLIFAVSATVHLDRVYNPCVVLAPNASLLLSPFASAEPVSTIGEGRLLYPLKHHQDFYYAVDEAGHKGWIARAAIEPVIPGSLQ